MPALAIENGKLVVGVSDDFLAGWLRDNFADLIDDALRTVTGGDMEFVFESGHPAIPREAEAVEEELNPETIPVPEVCEPCRRTAENCLEEYTFENFVTGEENRYAYAAAMTAANQPGTTANPLYIYGGSGMGKTHLIQAVANHIATETPSAKVCYTTCENFLNDYVDSLRTGSHFVFRDRYRNVDILLIDDVHQLSGKDRLKEEFFNTFNDLYFAKKQIILTSDRPPAEIPGLEERLVSRFESGVTVQITTPTFETRLAILRQKESNMHPKLSDEVLEFLAQRICSNIRPLDGALRKLSIYANAMQTEITIDVAEVILSDLLNKETETRRVSIDSIQKAVADYFNLSVRDLTGPKRPKNIAEPRMMAMYLARKLTDHSQQEIGLAFGGRNHATVIHAVKQVEDVCLRDPQAKLAIAKIQRHIRPE